MCMASRCSWKCTSCSTKNDTDRNHVPCKNCYTLDSEINLYRARALYILGNVDTISSALIPLKTPFFIYPLAPPIVAFTKSIKDKGIWINFLIDLYDSKHIEKYHIEKVKFDLSKNGKFNSTFIVHSLSPYSNIFSRFFDQPYFGSYTVDIFAKCYRSNSVSPKQTLKFTLLQNKPKKSSISDITLKIRHDKQIKKKHGKTKNTVQINLNNKQKQKLLDQKKEKLKKLKLRILENRLIIIKGCGNSNCTNPCCKSNLTNTNKTYTDADTSKMALKMIKFKYKCCKHPQNYNNTNNHSQYKTVVSKLSGKNKVNKTQTKTRTKIWQYKKISKWRNDDILDWIKDMNLEKEWNDKILEVIKNCECTGKDIKSLKTIQDIGESFDILDHKQLCNTILERMVKFKPKVKSAGEDDMKDAKTFKINIFSQEEHVVLNEEVNNNVTIQYIKVLYKIQSNVSANVDDINFYYKGKLLPKDSTLEQVNITSDQHLISVKFAVDGGCGL
eukprot:298592_1